MPRITRGERFHLSNRDIVSGDHATTFDVFHRRKVAQPHSLFSSTAEYGLNSLYWFNLTSGSGTIAHVPDKSIVEMSVSLEDDYAIAQTKQYFQYQPGKSQRTVMTGALAAVPGVISRFGYFDDQNGIYLEYDDGAYLVLRSSTSGTPVDLRVPQSEWNIDKCDGSGRSRFVLKPENMQLMTIELQWLGVGLARVSLESEIGEQVIVHEFYNSNTFKVPYMASAELPVRYEISSEGGEGTMILGCCSVVSEGGIEADRQLRFGANRGITPKSVGTTEVPLIAIRPKLEFGGKVNRANISTIFASAMTSASNILWRVRYGSTLTGANFQSVDALSAAEYDIAATAFSGGHVLNSGYLEAGQGASARSQVIGVRTQTPLVLDENNQNTIIYLLTGQALSGTASVLAALDWMEVY
jgi:hypothetical protein